MYALFQKLLYSKIISLMSFLIFLLFHYLQDNILRPPFPEQMAVHWHGEGERSRGQHRILRPLGLCHQLEQSNRIVSAFKCSELM